MQVQAQGKTIYYLEKFINLQKYLNNNVIGQEKLISRLIISLITNGHVVVEGAPGLAKTTAIKILSSCIQADFHRVQFTPDLLPVDITGTEIFKSQTSSFEFMPGPIFNNIVLADEINRAPAKVQSALLEAMAEKQITIGKTTYKLPELFMVMATQNPIEQEGTYRLPEAQLDRFLMYLKVDYPDSACEQKILAYTRQQAMRKTVLANDSQVQLSQEDIFKARELIRDVHLAPALESYLTQIVLATRKPEAYSNTLKNWIKWGASPRATFALDCCSRAHAWLHGRDYVSPEDIQTVAHDVLRHRIILTFEAEAENITTDMVIKELLSQIAVP